MSATIGIDPGLSGDKPKRRKPAKVSPTQRTLAHCRDLGWHASVVEKWNMHARIRQDMFGFVDIVAVDQLGAQLWIQATTRDHAAIRRAKIDENAVAALVCDRLLVEVWTWAKMGKAGKRKLWSLKRERMARPGEWTEVVEDAP